MILAGSPLDETASRSPISQNDNMNDIGPPSTARGSHVGDPHAFSPGLPEARGPCPALNALSNHGYLPRDGQNISAAEFLKALQDPETYHLSGPLAQVLVYGGFAMMHEVPNHTISLHELSRHGRIEHNASMVHKDAPTGAIDAPVRCDTTLLDDLLENKDVLTLDDIAKHRVILENVSKLDPVHQEVARGEWALVLGIFGKMYDGRVPTDVLRVWLKENRFPEGWDPKDKQGLINTMRKSWAIHAKMNEIRKNGESEKDIMDQGFLSVELKTRQQGEKGKRLESSTPSPRPEKRQKTLPEIIV